VILEDLIHTLGGPVLVQRLPLRVRPQQHAGDVEDDHGCAEGAAGAGLGDGLGAHAYGIGHAVGQIPVQVIGPAGALQVFPLPGDAVVLGVGQGVERLGEIVAALAQRLAVLGGGGGHPAARNVVDAVVLQEIDAALGRRQPLGAAAIYMAQIGEDPAAAALHPHTLIGGVDLTLSVQAGVHAAVLPVNAVFQPEIRAGLQFALHPIPVCL